MIPNEKKMMVLSCSKKIICIITQKNFKNKGDFYLLNCHHSFRAGNNLKPHEKVCKNKDICGIVIATEKKENIRIQSKHKII